MAKVYQEKQEDVTEKRDAILKLVEDDGDVDVMLVDENGEVISILLTILEEGTIMLYSNPELEAFGFCLDDDDCVEVEKD